MALTISIFGSLALLFALASAESEAAGAEAWALATDDECSVQADNEACSVEMRQLRGQMGLVMETTEGSAAPESPSCVPCGMTAWIATNGTSRSCCAETCYKGYYWTEYGSTVDCNKTDAGVAGLLQGGSAAPDSSSCVPCGMTAWIATNGTSMSCCAATCYKGYYWTEYGSTVDCNKTDAGNAALLQAAPDSSRCVPCGMTAWITTNGTSRSCCAETCYKGYYWTEYGSTVDCNKTDAGNAALLQESPAPQESASCVPCGMTAWIATNGTSMSCCAATCYKGYYWTEYGSTVDCNKTDDSHRA
eukprot:CAMPEP_0204517060 /NCGR_PEP_ID=MMETSP0661-20131031/3471_1 /ASSEMBLY_ACC=CAM_ASM_000606 /TAXON_ID=109239 /ORGANISM="Alexandrium margalefi, Strain AMGDE01CS-322" /LENGTH=303 /DNA_ID=CAMNT_0051522445 /DNA_START=56 /DNA_END=967 /DNA_ORIENTATION=-